MNSKAPGRGLREPCSLCCGIAERFRPMNKHELGDFTATPRMLVLALLAIAIGGIATCVAWALLRLIGFFTNIFYYGRFETQMVSPAGHHLGWFAVFIPVVGGLIIGVMARFGSE